VPVLKRILTALVAVPAAALLITLSIANRHAVRLVLDPFEPDAPMLSLVLPFYVYLFAALLAGIVLGGCTAWFGQARWRKAARVRSHEAARWQAEADRLTRERDQAPAGRKEIAAAGGGAG